MDTLLSIMSSPSAPGELRNAVKNAFSYRDQCPPEYSDKARIELDAARCVRS